MNSRLLTLAILATAVSTKAQSIDDLTYSYAFSGTGAIAITPNATLAFPSTVVGTSTSAVFTIKNGRAADVTLNSIAFSGPGFLLTGAPSSYPVTIKAGTSLGFNISFSPLILTRGQGSLVLNYVDGQAVFALDGQAVASLQSFIFSYIINPSGNQTAIASGQTVPFPAAAVGSSTTATFIIRNNITGTAATSSLTVSGISLTGDPAFAASGLPLFPAALAPQAEIRFTLTFTPASATASSGAVNVRLLDSSITFNLQGQGLASTLKYEVLSGSDFQQIQPEDKITLPPVAVSTTTGTGATIRIRNTGTASGRVAAIAFSTTTNSFSLLELPGLPATLAPGDAVTFVIVFTPKSVGDNSVRLRIDNAFFNVTGVGLGPLLQISVDTGAGSVIVGNNGVLSIPNTIVGDKRTFPVSVQNSGNLPTAVNAVAVTGPSYSIVAIPNLPVRLEAGDSINFEVTFAPTTTGTISGTLQVEDQSITLRGVGATPPPLPGVTINLTDQLQAQQQPTVSVVLSQTYPYDLTGVLTMSFTADSLVDDTSIQYAAGGRTIAFRIPANTTTAVFGTQESGSTQALFQVGTISGKLLFTATFAVASVDLTSGGSTAPTKTSTIAAVAPVISSLKPGIRTTTSIEILVSGYSNTRELSQMVFVFTGTPSGNITAGTLNANVQSAFDGWYQGTSSKTFGSQFTASVVFNISGDPTTLQSVAVTATNSKGTSAPKSIALN